MGGSGVRQCAGDAVRGERDARCQPAREPVVARLDALPGRVVADAVGGRLGQQVADPDVGVSRMIEGAPVRVEVRAGTGRSGVVRLMRVRGED